MRTITKKVRWNRYRFTYCAISSPAPFWANLLAAPFWANPLAQSAAPFGQPSNPLAQPFWANSLAQPAFVAHCLNHRGPRHPFS